MYRHILIPTDGSELAGTAVRHGLALAKAVGAKVTALTVEGSFDVYTVPASRVYEMSEAFAQHAERAKAHAQNSAMHRRTWSTSANLRRRLYEILEHGTIGDRTAVMVSRLIVILIVINLVAMILDSVPALQAQYGPLFFAIEVLSLVAFTIEYGLRVWVAAEHAPNRHASERKSRWKFVSSPLGVIDLLAVLPFWLALVLPADLRVFLVFRMVRFLKLARYSPAMRSLLDALNNERRALFGCFVILLGATLVAA